MGLRAVVHPPGPAGLRSLLAARRCIQLDPLDRIGTNADLVAMARVDGVGRGDVHRHLQPGHAFEHFAKERCLLPAEAFPAYRGQAAQTPWWRQTDRMKRLPAGVVDAVLAEVRARGPITAADLSDHGAVEPIDWSGWKGTAKAATMALEVLWTRCRVVTCGRSGRGRVYDVPERALPTTHDAPAPPDFARWAVLERAEAAGLLPTATGPWWFALRNAREAGGAEGLVAVGAVVRKKDEGSRRTYYAPANFRERVWPDDDGRMRILGPLDPLLWCRPLIAHLFDFEYVWEVYVPAAKRRWGYYVVPLLHHGRLVGRFEGRHVDGEVLVERLWVEPGAAFDEAAFCAALERHAAAG
ncbi:MAG: YcaQ family DNA glycosylase [Myxococcales bacterium]|nr:YcaQ family DNA glycosylase [Myxococcales bacterium]